MSQGQQNKRPLFLVVGLGIILTLGVLIWAQTQFATAEDHPHLSPSAYQTDFAESAVQHILVDVRTPEEFSTGHIAEALNIPLQSLPNRLSELPNDQPIIVYCRSGNRSAQATQILLDAGYTQVYDLGGILNWTAQGYPLH